MPPPTDAPTAVLPEQVPSSKEHADETSIDMLTGRSRTNPSLPNIEFDPTKAWRSGISAEAPVISSGRLF